MKKKLTKELSKEEELELLELLTQKAILNSKTSLWEFCKTRESDYYTKNKQYLKNICDTLQKLYEGKLLKPDGKPYRCLMLSIPPRFGKSRTLTNFTAWCLGKDIKNMIMTISYNDDSATDFSRFTRDIIMQDKAKGQIVFSDIFPNVRIKQGNAAVDKWALEGRFFSYLGAGFNGSVTGKGCSIMIIDDPVKSATEAMNDDFLEGIYKKYTDTLLSRIEGNGIQIICQTRWSKKDICGKILQSEDALDWYVLNLPAYDEVKDKMLCEEVLSKENYFKLKRNMSEIIFLANYQQKTIDRQGALYQKTLKTYDDIPRDDEGNSLFEEIKNYTDTADTGTDNLCSICYGVYNHEAYVLDVYYTNKGMEITEPATAKLLFDNKVNVADIESNNGGRGFARAVEKILLEKYNSNHCLIKWFHQSKNKVARILSESNFVMEHIYFPKNWKTRFPKFYEDMISYQRNGKNSHDDAQDTVTGIAEMLNSNSNGFFDFLKSETERIKNQSEQMSDIPHTRERMI